MSRAVGKYGMSRFEPNEITLLASDYLNTASLPKLPHSFGHFSNTPPGGGEWGWGANNQVGDCVLAGAAHEEMSWAAASKRPVPTFSDITIKTQYLVLTGGKDTGLDPVATAKWRQNHGLVDDKGIAHKIKAYTLIENLVQLDYFSWLFGAAGVGLMLPDSADAQFHNGHPWDDTSEKRKNGHYVVALGRRRDGMRVVATWNDIQAVSDAYFEKYFVGGVGYFSENYLMPTGVSPEAINMAQLEDDLNAIREL